MVFDQTKNELEIKKLKQENETIDQLRDEVRKLREFQAEQDKKIIKNMKNEGVIIG